MQPVAVARQNHTLSRLHSPDGVVGLVDEVALAERGNGVVEHGGCLEGASGVLTGRCRAMQQHLGEVLHNDAATTAGVEGVGPAVGGVGGHPHAVEHTHKTNKVRPDEDSAVVPGELRGDDILSQTLRKVPIEIAAMHDGALGVLRHQRGARPRRSRGAIASLERIHHFRGVGTRTGVVPGGTVDTDVFELVEKIGHNDLADVHP
mmetsp:Transcript_44763/g.105390  ORF Transcript_44763/g.105390 Transcript_44763/m.105390 type:complete len:205 (-) Transcript_44763:686-1300(-)